MECCANCFGDSFLCRQIDNWSDRTGVCSYCSANGVSLVEPIRLRDHFELLLEAYCEDTGGKALVDWLKYDWGLFDCLSSSQCEALLSGILDDGEIVGKRFRPVISDDGGSLERWQRFRQELKHENRFFPKNIPDLDRLGQLLEDHLRSAPEDIPDVLYRARAMDGDQPHPPDMMGKPPQGVSTHGRANPAGIPYLYLASDVSTAIAEMRPHPGEHVCVAAFKVISKPKTVDLRNPRKTISPFSLSDEREFDVAQLRSEVSFLCQLGEELTRPVLPREAHLEYLPSQYLCEFIKHCGFDGVMYRSSVGGGVNFALFADAFTGVGAVEVYTVTRVNVEYAAMAASPGAS